MRIYTYISFCVAAVLVVGCKSLETTGVDQSIAMPDTYAGSVEESNSSSLVWQEFFDDEVLKALIDTALNNNQDLLTMFQRIEMARANVRMRKGAMLPVAEGFGSIAQRKFGLYTMDGAGNITTPIYEEQLVPIHLPDYYMGVQTSWEADIWGKLRSMKQAALASYLASEEGKNWVVTSLVAEVANTWYGLLATDRELSILRETILLQENAVSLVEIQKQAGRVSELAVEQFKAQLLNFKSLDAETRQRVLELESSLNILLGRFPQPIDRAGQTFEGIAIKSVSAGIPSELLENRPDIKQAELELVASRASVKAAKAAFYPSFNISGAVGFQAFNPSFLFSTPESVAYSLIGGLVAPLVNRSALEADFQSANAGQREAYYNYQKTILEAYAEVYNELASIRNVGEAYAFKGEESEVLSKSVNTATELFRTGRADYLEVILTQKNALEAGLDLVSLKQRQLQSTVNLYRALGGGWR